MRLLTTEKMDEFVQKEFIYKYNLVPGFDIKKFWDEKLDFELRPVQTFKETERGNKQVNYAFYFDDKKSILYYVDEKLGKKNLDKNDIIMEDRYIRVRLASAINTLMCYHSKIEQEKNNLDYIIYTSEDFKYIYPDKKLYTTNLVQYEEDLLFAESLLLPRDYLEEAVFYYSDCPFEELENEFDVPFSFVYNRCKKLKLIK